MTEQTTEPVAFENLRFMVNRQIHEIRRLLHELQLEERALDLNHIYHTLNEVPFQLAVVGDFSRGKSTFINALLGADLLPSKTVPTTTFITHILHAEREEVMLEYEDDSTEKVELKAFKSMRAPRQPDESDKEEMKVYQEEIEALSKITRARVGYPLPYEATQQFEIVDTPGMNDVFDQREAITRGYLPSSDAILFLLSATNPISESEKTFLEKEILSRDIRNVFFILNFKDRLQSVDQEERVKAYIEEQLHKVRALTDIKLFVVSSLEALQHKQLGQGMVLRRKPKVFTSIEETGFPAFEASLTRFLHYDLGKVKAAKELRRLNRMIGEIRQDELASRRAALRQDQDALKKEFRTLNQKVKQLKADMEKRVNAGIEELNQEETGLIARFKKAQRTLTKETLSRFDSYDSMGYAEVRSVDELTEQIMADVRNQYGDLTAEYTGEIDERIQTGFDDIQSDLGELAASFNHEQPEAAENALAFSESAFTIGSGRKDLGLSGLVQQGTNVIRMVTRGLGIFSLFGAALNAFTSDMALDRAKRDTDVYLDKEHRKQLKQMKNAFRGKVQVLGDEMQQSIKRSHNLYRDHINGIKRDLKLTGAKQAERERQYNRIEDDLIAIQKRAAEIVNTYCDEELKR